MSYLLNGLEPRATDKQTTLEQDKALYMCFFKTLFVSAQLIFYQFSLQL